MLSLKRLQHHRLCSQYTAKQDVINSGTDAVFLHTDEMLAWIFLIIYTHCIIMSSVGWVWAMLPRTTRGGADVCLLNCRPLQTARDFVLPLLWCGKLYAVIVKKWKWSWWTCLCANTFTLQSVNLIKIIHMKSTPENTCCVPNKLKEKELLFLFY